MEDKFSEKKVCGNSDITGKVTSCVIMSSVYIINFTSAWLMIWMHEPMAGFVFNNDSRLSFPRPENTYNFKYNASFLRRFVRLESISSSRGSKVTHHTYL